MHSVALQGSFWICASLRLAMSEGTPPSLIARLFSAEHLFCCPNQPKIQGGTVAVKTFHKRIGHRPFPLPPPLRRFVTHLTCCWLATACAVRQAGRVVATETKVVGMVRRDGKVVGETTRGDYKAG